MLMIQLEVYGSDIGAYRGLSASLDALANNTLPDTAQVNTF